MRSKYKWIFTLLIALTMQFSFAQEKTVTGVVSDASGTLPGANVVIKGTTKGTQTDINGKYSIKAKEGDVLVFSFVGMSDMTAKVGTSNVVSVKMQDGMKLSEVVVNNGYRSTTKANSSISQTTVRADVLENKPNASFLQSLQGQMAGVNIASTNGQPGAKNYVQIRGLGSLTANTEPLYVIDGMPTDGNNFRSINASDIESVTVLKDAAATAIYGNRGSNGVMVVRTKRGGTSGEKVKFRYSVSSGFNYLPTSNYSFANSAQLLQIEKNKGVGFGATKTPDEIASLSQINTNWAKFFFRTATTLDHNFSVENQGKNLNSMTSVGYFKQDGILKTSAIKRFTFRNNLTGHSENDKFTYSTNFAAGFSKNDQPSQSAGSGSSWRNFLYSAYSGAPYLQPSDYLGSADLVTKALTTPFLLYRPLAAMDYMNTYVSFTEELRLNANVEMGYKLDKNFTLKSRTSNELIQTRSLSSESPNSFLGLIIPATSSLQFGGQEEVTWRREYRFSQLFQLDYKKTFAEKHSVNALANMEYNRSQANQSYSYVFGLDPKVYVPDTGKGYVIIPGNANYTPTVSLLNQRVNMISYFGLLDYDFDGRFGVVGTVRRDGTSRFDNSDSVDGTNQQWGTFWSVAGRWNIDNESFMKNQTLFQTLKLRASYGVTGNQRVTSGDEFSGTNPTLFSDLYSSVTNRYNNRPGYSITYGFPTLHWEITKQTNLGLDFEMVKNRLRGNVDFYNKLTSDLFYSRPVSVISGTTAVNKNSELEVVNKGVELNLAYDLVKNTNFVLTLRANGAYNKNLVQGFTGDDMILDGDNILKNGSKVYEFNLFKYAGVNPSNGQLLFQAADGSLTEKPSLVTDRFATGKSSLPEYTGGFGLDVDYKGFFLNSTFTFAAKLWRIDGDYYDLYDPSNIGVGNVSSDLLNAWTPTNTLSNIPSLTASNYSSADTSDRYLKDASFIRLRNLTIGYKLPKKFLDKSFMSSLSVYLQGQNLVTFSNWDGYDVEGIGDIKSLNFPTPKIYSLGLDLKF